ncbi:UPF0728 protein C10orf53 homolog [Gadus macrocephalus]|uniref:Chromosome 10 open reading frame 53 n=1 Tax=Gadus morhua TaxID=8049 RepID=A0A8C5CY61_GADMO|nr:UPF0728 protein C10orf53 homolog [Gadus chalcogrammus]XP_059929763.1 UPF0728 protein C10orf53 homolog [Gadus macrocephalus]
MPKNATVSVRYGPYESCGLVAYRTFRLEGLESSLLARGHRCVLEESRDWNTVEIVVHGECVFTCGVKDLQFGGDGRLDPVCQKAVIAVENAY